MECQADVGWRLRLSAISALLSGRKDVIVVSSVSCLYGIGNPQDFSPFENVLSDEIKVDAETIRRLKEQGYFQKIFLDKK